MVLRFFPIPFALFLLFSCGGNVKNGNKEDIKNVLPDGNALYIENCASCHGLDGTLGKAGSKDLSKTTLDFQQLKNVIEVGTGNGMPRFKEILGGEEEVDAVVQYVMGFKRI
jgi:cytochrome c6